MVYTKNIVYNNVTDLNINIGMIREGRQYYKQVQDIEIYNRHAKLRDSLLAQSLRIDRLDSEDNKNYRKNVFTFSFTHLMTFSNTKFTFR